MVRISNSKANIEYQIIEFKLLVASYKFVDIYDYTL